MANPIPNDLSHMSDEDFNALCPQGKHAPGPEPLSPAAQAVSNAAKSSLDWEAGYLPNAVAAAALRAAADQVTPEDFAYDSGSFADGALEFEQGQNCRNEASRSGLLAIAAELKAHHE